MKKLRLFAVIILVLVIATVSLHVGKSINQEREPELSSFITINLAGYLFFITLPVELLVPYFTNNGFSPLLIFWIAVITAMISQTIDYWIGYLVPHKYIEEMIGEKEYNKALKSVKKHAKWMIFLFNLFPLSSPIMVCAAGIIKYDFKYTMFYSFLGLSLKYAVIILVF